MKPRKNMDVRMWIIEHGLTYTEVAKEIPMSNAGFSGLLQSDLTKGEKREIIVAAKRALLKKEKGESFNEEAEFFA